VLIGMCGTCSVRLVNGIVSVKDNEHTVIGVELDERTDNVRYTK